MVNARSMEDEAGVTRTPIVADAVNLIKNEGFDIHLRKACGDLQACLTGSDFDGN